MMTPEEFGETLLAIAAGKDPWAKVRKKHPDGVPGLGGEADPLRWDHRIAALKLYGEYAYGKPVQGVVVQAEIDQRLSVAAANTGPIDVKALPPEIRLALRAAAQHALGLPSAPQTLEPITVTEAPAAPPSILLPQVDEDGIHLEFFRESSNLYDARLVNGILSVRFKTKEGEPGTRVYKYRNVTPEMMKLWKAAPSAGAWFAREIRVRHMQYPEIVPSAGAVV